MIIEQLQKACVIDDYMRCKVHLGDAGEGSRCLLGEAFDLGRDVGRFESVKRIAAVETAIKALRDERRLSREELDRPMTRKKL